ncbi:MAG: hypothetical protein ABSB23_16325 [Bryobacteraceae bacterium]
MLAIVPATAVKVADIAPDATLTEDGTLSAVVLLESVTVTPPAPAACDSVTVQVVTHPEFRLVGLQDTKLTEVAANSDIEADCEPPL